jgi:hypothetical protein
MVTQMLKGKQKQIEILDALKGEFRYERSGKSR